MSIKTNPAVMIGNLDRQELIQAVATTLRSAIVKELDSMTKTCLNCDHFNPTKELCTFNGTNQRPPAKVIVSGCSAHRDEIPF